MPDKDKDEPIDILVSNRMLTRRKAIGISQAALAEAVGVTAQQIQKYETGKNRISAGRLYKIASALDVPVAYFFEGAPKHGKK